MLEEDDALVVIEEEAWAPSSYPSSPISSPSHLSPLSISNPSSRNSSSSDMSTPFVSSAAPQRPLPPLPLAALGKATNNFSSDPAVMAAISSPLMELQGVDHFADSKLREKIRIAQSSYHNLELFQTQIKQFSKSSRDFMSTGADWVAQGTKCAQKLTDFSMTSKKESEVYRQFGETFGEIIGMMGILMEQMDSLVGHGFQSIFKPKADEKPLIPDTSELQKQLVQSQTEYDNTLRKALTTKSEDKKSAKKLGADLAESKEKLERVVKHFSVKVDKIEDALRLRVLEQMCSYMYATHTYFLQGHRLLSSLEPMMRQLMTDIEQEKKDARFKNKRRFADHRVSLRVEGSLIAGRAKQGYLFKKSDKNSLKGWLIRWVVLANRKLYWYKKWKNFDHSDYIDLASEHIRIVEDPAHKLCFSIVSPKRTLQLKTSNEKDFREWVTVLRNICPSGPTSNASTPNLLVPGLKLTQTTLSTPYASSLGTTPGTDLSARGPRPSNADVYIPAQQQQIRACLGNDKCADCSKEEPDYIVIGTGILVCTECATIHKDSRNFCLVKPFGSELAAEEILLLLATGNMISNDFFEYNIPADIAKPNPQTTRPDKYDFIRQKYVQAAFLPLVDFDADEISQKLLEAIEKGDTVRIIQLAAYGADVNCINTEDGFQSLLHYAVGQKVNPTITITLLLALGAEINIQDHQGQTPLHYCVVNDHIESGKLLVRLGASIDLISGDGHNAVQLAHERKATWFLETVKEVIAIARLDESDALYSRLTKAAKRLSNKTRRGVINQHSHRPSNAEATAEQAAQALAATANAPSGPGTPRFKLSFSEEGRIPKPGSLPYVPPISLSGLSPGYPGFPGSPGSPGSYLASVAPGTKKWRSSSICQNLPKGVQQLTYSPRPRSNTRGDWGEGSSIPGVTSPLGSPPSRRASFFVGSGGDESSGGSGISFPNSPPLDMGLLEDNFSSIDLGGPVASPPSSASSSSSSLASGPFSFRGRGVSLSDEGEKILSLDVPKSRGLTFNGAVNSLGSSLGSGSSSPLSSPLLSSGNLTPRSAERRVTLLLGEVAIPTGEGRVRSSSLPKDKLERRPSQVIIQPRKEKILVREESLVNIEF